MDQSTLIKIRNYGALKYAPERICKMLGLFGEDSQRFLVEFEDEESQIRQFYDQGVAIGDYNIDAELAKQSEKGEILAIIQLQERQEKTKISTLKHELFGI